MDLQPNTADLPLPIIDSIVKSEEDSDFVGALYETVFESIQYCRLILGH